MLFRSRRRPLRRPTLAHRRQLANEVCESATPRSSPLRPPALHPRTYTFFVRPVELKLTFSRYSSPLRASFRLPLAAELTTENSWPVYTPAPKLADWLESYAHSLELNVWMSTSVKSATFDDAASEWTIELERGVDGKVEQRTLKPKVVVWACGLGGGEPRMPVIEGIDRKSVV